MYFLKKLSKTISWNWINAPLEWMFSLSSPGWAVRVTNSLRSGLLKRKKGEEYNPEEFQFYLQWIADLFVKVWHVQYFIIGITTLFNLYIASLFTGNWRTSCQSMTFTIFYRCSYQTLQLILGNFCIKYLWEFGNLFRYNSGLI